MSKQDHGKENTQPSKESKLQLEPHLSKIAITLIFNIFLLILSLFYKDTTNYGPSTLNLI